MLNNQKQNPENFAYRISLDRHCLSLNDVKKRAVIIPLKFLDNSYENLLTKTCLKTSTI